MEEKQDKPDTSQQTGQSFNLEYNWQQVLGPGEQIKKDFGLGDQYLKVGFILSAALGLLLSLLIIGVFIIVWSFFYWKFYLKKAFRYAFTNKRVLVHRGWLSTNLISVDYNKITDIQVRENIFEKWLFKTGAIVVNTAGTNYHEVIIDKITGPYKIKQELENLRSQFQNK